MLCKAPGVPIDNILLPNSPEHKAALSVGYERAGWDVSLSGRWVDKFPWSAGVFQGDVPNYSTVDLAASFDISENVRVGLNVANLVDNLHRQTFGGDVLTRRALTNLVFNW